MRLPQMVGLSLSTLIVIAVAACSSTTGSGTSAPTTGRGSSSGPAQNGGTYQLPTTVTSLRIDGDAVSIDVTAQDSASVVTVREQLHGKATTTKNVTGSSATLTAKCPSGFSFGVDCSVEYTVTMPARVTLDVDGAAGDMKLNGPLANATISTKAGRVHGTSLGAGTYEVTTNAGEVNLKFASPPNSVKVKSDVAAVALTVPGGTKYAVTTDTTVGIKNVEVDQDSSSTHRLDVTTTVGTITIDKG
jgi:Putative adhesin